jgi:hypothetical protein
MKQAYKLLLFLGGLPLIAATLAEWIPFAVDERVSLQAPTQPTQLDLAKLAPGKDMQHTRVWMVRATEGMYQVLRLPNKSSISRTDTAGRRAFYAGVFTSVIRNESAQFLSVTPFPTAGGAGMEYKYKGLHKGTGKRVIKYGRVLLVDSISYMLNFIPTDRQDSLGLAGAEQRRRFFNSITVKP